MFQLKHITIITMIVVLLAGSHISMAAESAPPFIQLEPVYNAVAKKSLLIKAIVGDADGVKTVNLFYRSAGSKVYKVLPMRKDDNNLYIVTIPKISYPGLEFYIEATDMAGSKSAEGSAAGPYLTSVSKSKLCDKKWLCGVVAGSLVLAAVIYGMGDSGSTNRPEPGSATIAW